MASSARPTATPRIASTLALSTFTCAPEIPGTVWIEVSQSSGTSREA